jgi:hypothetical protein
MNAEGRRNEEGFGWVIFDVGNWGVMTDSMR